VSNTPEVQLDSQSLDPKAVLERMTARAGVLLVEGPAGIGKTFRWSTVVEEARDRGWRVLVARPGPTERELAGSGLIDLCTEVTDEEIAELPEVQARALGAALLRRDDVAEADPRIVAVGFSSLLHRLAGVRPVLLAIDDLQWLESGTAEVVEYAVRRLPRAGAGLAATLRTEPAVAEPALVAHLTGAIELERVLVPPLRPDAAEHLVRTLAPELPTSSRRRIVEISAGNPLYLRELTAAALRSGTGNLAPSLDRLVGQRLKALPDTTRFALAAAAGLRSPTRAQVARVTPLSSLEPAQRAGIIQVEDGGEVRFTHPLFAEAARHLLPEAEWRQLNARLADVVDNVEQKARHRGLACLGPDRAVAQALDEAHGRALSRGALAIATDSLSQAVVHTPESDSEYWPRRIRLGRLLARQGDVDAARKVLTSISVEAGDADQRARALVELAYAESLATCYTEGCEVALRALAIATEPATRVAAHLMIADSAQNKFVAAHHAEQAIDVLTSELPHEHDKLLVARALRVDAGFSLGESVDIRPVEAWLDVERSRGSVNVSWPSTILLLLLWCTDQDDALCRAFDRLQRDLEHLPEDPQEIHALRFMAGLDYQRGEFPAALARARDAVACADRMGISPPIGAWSEMARCHAVLGDAESAHEAVDRLREACHDDPQRGEARVLGAAGVTALHLGDLHTVVANLTSSIELADSLGWVYDSLRSCPPLVDALIGLGEIERADALLTEFERRVEGSATTPTLGAAYARRRAWIQALRGDTDAALSSIAGALEAYQQLTRPFERAQALQTKGQILRRTRKKAAAREALAEAVTEFDRLGAVRYAGRARAELKRAGGLRASHLDLTETERRVAELTAEGRTAAETASTLFMAPGTVYNTLTRVYRKLGVRNRAELAALLKEREIPLVP
jgi:DNA-binding CsgD family transcriptional regulator